ncbi:F-box/LRR-repeat protein 7 [Hondaea fermentalgiana]|uniref:F-box/LRR-repeat protein 7 n=1 Tax=Hondaea fermentalgiana TaxID=2315210 RepID=A0A2R5GRW6_9STRA|nr:F-box/LRR-repeat protein 7 [Hondaea fermentalgiana]|eukprot:GBG33590.1 F-box/LRR-repeat protein 7 [Hondaea fermentalgiana]
MPRSRATFITVPTAIRYATLRYATLRYATLRYETIRYATLRDDTIRDETMETLMLSDWSIGVCGECRESLLVARGPHASPAPAPVEPADEFRAIYEDHASCFHCGASGSVRAVTSIKPHPCSPASIKLRRRQIEVEEEKANCSDDDDANLDPPHLGDMARKGVVSPRPTISRKRPGLVDLVYHEYGLWETVLSYLRPEAIGMLSLTCHDVSAQLWGRQLDLLQMEPIRWFGRTALARCFVSRSVRRRWYVQGIALDCRDANVREVLDVALEPLVLRSLAIRGAGQRGLLGLSACRWLTTLDLSLNPLDDLSPLTALRDLRDLRLEGCETLTSVEPLASCEELRALHLSGCRGLSSLRGLEFCTNLQELDLSLCFSLFSDHATAVAGLADLASLRSLALQGCSQLVSCPSLPPLLEKIDLGSCDQLVDISALKACAKSLKEVLLSGCDSLANLDVLVSCKALRVLDLSHCYSVVDVGLVAKCSALEHLFLGGCIGLQSVALAERTSLQYLSLTGCANLADLSGLAHCKSLTHLDLGFCASLQSVAALEACSSLEYVNLTRCSSLKSVSAFAKLPAMRRLCVRWCPQVSLAQVHALPAYISVVST